MNAPLTLNNGPVRLQERDVKSDLPSKLAQLKTSDLNTSEDAGKFENLMGSVPEGVDQNSAISNIQNSYNHIQKVTDKIGR